MFIFFITLLGYGLFTFFQNPPRTLDFSKTKTISINDNGSIFTTVTSAKTIADMLQEKKIVLDDHDMIIPDKNTLIYPGINIQIARAIKVRIFADEEIREIFTLTKTVESAIIDSRITLGEDDLVAPTMSTLLKNDLKISITRVEIKEEILPKPIDFKTISEEDASLGWRIKKTKQKGIKGIKEINYRVVTHDNKEISRKILEENVVQEPTPEIIMQGTYMKLGKAGRGDASYYASGWGEMNASRTIPRGGFAKVTNLDNGKSTIVKINDFGPQSPQRIIDLSYASFSKIGDLGQGILHNVKVEQVLN
ncbi:MAG: 3D/G5 domain protein [Candidatus Moranbacteria bacterium GW2011_GWA2_39_41]|nr:MAG: 3D/G5 domain protein [Candidatus Moranbacteria bacterium GW2011_GWA2_39_41]